MEKYYESGQLESKASYKDGELHGLMERYYENGQLKSKRATGKTGNCTGCGNISKKMAL